MDSAARAQRIMDRSDELAAISEEPDGITRRYGTPELTRAIELAEGWMRQAGMTTRRDNIGNLIGRYDADPAIPDPQTLLIGGHLDTVRDAGRYDGTLGVLTGVAAVEQLTATRSQLPVQIEVIAFADEEGLRFHTSFLGSRPVAGDFWPDVLSLADDDGITVAEAIRAFGGDPEALASARRDPATLRGFIEVHIEQGPVLEQENLPVGIVSAIAGGSKAEIRMTGMAGHAGTVPMNLRRDALAAAAEFVLAVETTGHHVPDLVATVGQMAVSPGASNVIAGSVELTLDVRHPEDAIRLTAVNDLRAVATTIGTRRNVDVTWQDIPSYNSVASDPSLIAVLEEAIAAEGITPRLLPSGAGHDAVTLSAITPVSMLFVRCKDGISHNPAESITTGDVDVAIRVLDRFIGTMAADTAS